MQRPLTSLFIALLAALVWQLPAIVTVGRSIKQDSFLTLAPLAATGLALLTTILIGIVIYTNTRVSVLGKKYLGSNFISLILALGMSYVLFAFLWAMSSQIFYFYYLLVFDNLPLQWVVRDWLPLEATANLFLSSNNHNTSRLAPGIALIFLLVHTFLLYRPLRR